MILFFFFVTVLWYSQSLKIKFIVYFYFSWFASHLKHRMIYFLFVWIVCFCSYTIFRLYLIIIKFWNDLKQSSLHNNERKKTGSFFVAERKNLSQFHMAIQIKTIFLVRTKQINMAKHAYAKSILAMYMRLFSYFFYNYLFFYINFESSYF